MWLPISSAKQIEPVYETQMDFIENPFFSVVGRLRPGISLSQAQVQMDLVAAERAAGQITPIQRGGSSHDWRKPWPRLLPASEVAGRKWKQMSLLLEAAVFLVLLIACSDAAGILLARGERRQRETAVRLALGASRFRVARPLIFEGLIISFASMLVGVFFAAVTIKLLLNVDPARLVIPVQAAVSLLDLRILSFAVVICLLTALSISVVPAVQALRAPIVSGLRGEAFRVVTVGKRRVPWRTCIVAFQVAASTFLLTGTGFLLQTIWKNVDVDTGLDSNRVIVADLNLAKQGYSKTASEAFLGTLQNSLRSVPGIKSISLAAQMQTGVRPTSDSSFILVYFPMVTSDYFNTLKIPITRGRSFSTTDHKGTQFVGVVSESFARQFWPGENPLGKHIDHVSPQDASIEIVGVAADARVRNILKLPPPTLYVPLDQFYGAFPWQPVTSLYVKRLNDSPVVYTSILRTATQLDKDLVLYSFEPLQARLTNGLEDRRFLARLFLAFGLLALLLGATGLYGLVAYSVGTRRKEISIRIALGAQPSKIINSFLRKGTMLTLAAIICGMIGSIVLVRFLQSLIAETRPLDPWVFILVGCVMYGAMLVPCYRAARQAIAVEPSRALKHE
jgi:predicted permease